MTWDIKTHNILHTKFMSTKIMNSKIMTPTQSPKWKSNLKIELLFQKNRCYSAKFVWSVSLNSK